MTLTAETLHKLYVQDSLNDYQVAALYCVSRNTLRSLRALYGIPSKTNKKGLSSDVISSIVSMLEEGQTLTVIAEKFGVFRTSIRKLLVKNNIETPVYRAKHPRWVSSYTLTDLQKEVLLGDMFGDGGLVATSSDSAYYHTGHSLQQASFVQWKASVLSPLTSRYREDLERNTVSAGTWTAPCLKPLHSSFYPSGAGNKVLTGLLAKDMSPRSLAVWYMGDGSINRNTGVFHVGLNNDVKSIAEVLSAKFDLRFEARKYAREWHLRVMQPAKFFPLVAPYMIDLFRYKVPVSYQNLVGNQQPSLGGNPSEGSETRQISTASVSARHECKPPYHESNQL